MASAAKSIQASPIAVETGPIPLPGIAEMFAAMISGAGSEGGEGAPSEGAAPEVKPEDAADPAATMIDASVLLPMLDQQRAATPAAKLVPETIVTPAKLRVAAKDAGEPPVVAAPAEAVAVAHVIEPALAGEKPVATTEAPAKAAKSADPVPVMRELKDAAPAPVTSDETPVVRSVTEGKAAPKSGADPIPVMRDIATKLPVAPRGAEPAPVMREIADKSPAPPKGAERVPVMRVLGDTQPAAATKIEPVPVMRPDSIGTPAAKASSEAVPVMRVIDSVATTVAPQPIAPVTIAQPAQAQAQAATESPVPVQAAAMAEAQAAPVAAKPRGVRTIGAPTEVRSEPSVTTDPPVPATATETRTAVQPLTTAQPLVQPAAAPIAAPVQNVAAALSQQVLDMSAGDQWIEQAARDIAQASAKDGAMRFRLAPETLGELKVEITQSERGAHVRLNVSSEAAQQALVAAEPKLVAEARVQGVRIAETEINFTGGQSQGREASAHAREQGQQQSQHAQQPRGSRGSAANTFTSSAAAPEGRGRTDRYA